MGVFESLLNNTLSVERRTRTDDGQGGWTIGYSSVGTIEGRIWPLSATERLVAESEEQQITHVIACAAGENISRGDRVTVDDLTVEVLGIRELSQAGEHWEIDCLERQDEETT